MIKMKHALVGSALMALCAVASASMPPAAINLVNNGSFETGDFSGWSLAGNTGYTSVAYGVGVYAPTDGSFLGSFGAVSSDSYLSQSLTTTAGTKYALSFDIVDEGASSGQDFSVTVGGNTLMSIGSQSGGYQHETFDFVAGAGSSTTLQFALRNDPNYWGLDNVAVTAVASAVPEASSTAMLLAGLGLLGFVARRRQSR